MIEFNYLIMFVLFSCYLSRLF